MRSSLYFIDIKIIAVPAAGFVNDPRLLRTIQAVLVRKERFDPVRVCKLRRTLTKTTKKTLNKQNLPQASEDAFPPGVWTCSIGKRSLITKEA